MFPKYFRISEKKVDRSAAFSSFFHFTISFPQGDIALLTGRHQTLWITKKCPKSPHKKLPTSFRLTRPLTTINDGLPLWLLIALDFLERKEQQPSRRGKKRIDAHTQKSWSMVKISPDSRAHRLIYGWWYRFDEKRKDKSLLKTWSKRPRSKNTKIY